MALAALVPLLGSLAGGTAASAGLLGAGMSGITGALTASAIGSGLGTLAVTGDPMKALESGALGFLTGGALGGFGSGIGNAAVEAEKAAAAAAAGGAGAGAVGGELASAEVDAAKNAIIGNTAQDVAQTAATAGADALGNATGTAVGNLGTNAIVQTGAPALATAPGMGIGQAFKDTLGGIGGMKGLMKAGEVALPGISMSQPELAPYVAPVYTSPGLTPYQQREAGGYTPGYRPGYDPEQLYFKPAAGFADGGEVPGYADGNVVRLADGTRNMPNPSVNNIGQQPNQLGRRYDQDRTSGFNGQNEQRGLGNNMQPQNQFGMQAAKSGRPMGQAGQSMQGMGGGQGFNNPMQMGQGMPQPNQQMGQPQQSMPQTGFADGGPIPASGVKARPGLNLTGVKQTGFNPAMLMAQYNGGYDRGPFAGGNPFFAGRERDGGGIKGNGMRMPFGGSMADNRPGLKMAFADGGATPPMGAMSAMGMMGGMPGMPGGDMTVPPIAGDGSSDSIPATIDGKAPALLSADEHVIPSDVVAHLGNGSSSVGHKKLRNMVKRVRVKKTGKKGLPERINPERMMPA